MKAVALTRYLPISDPNSLVDVELPKPAPKGRDLLVAVKAVSVNPVDTKVRAPKETVEKEPRVLGWDAAGVVESVGEGVTNFKVGDEVYYAGDITRSGSNAEFQLVDERIVGRKPKALSFAEAAALPLTAITAWEALFDHLGIDLEGGDRGRTLLLIGAAGGVGSITIQLAKMVGLTVIATASRPETVKWVLGLGADHVVDHRQPLPAQLAALGHKEVDFIAPLASTDPYWAAMAEMIKPQGHIVALVDNVQPLDLKMLKRKSASFHWTFMFTRPVYQTPDMEEQGILLNEVADMVDAGQLRATHSETLKPINAANLRAVHAKLESGKAVGKITLEGW
jgi:zinc-binding alcohol dehydrogenase family protein